MNKKMFEKEKTMNEKLPNNTMYAKNSRRRRSGKETTQLCAPLGLVLSKV